MRHAWRKHRRSQRELATAFLSLSPRRLKSLPVRRPELALYPVPAKLECPWPALLRREPPPLRLLPVRLFLETPHPLLHGEHCGLGSTFVRLRRLGKRKSGEAFSTSAVLTYEYVLSKCEDNTPGRGALVVSLPTCTPREASYDTHQVRDGAGGWALAGTRLSVQAQHLAQDLLRDGACHEGRQL